jgi:hypothetical protein
VSTESTPSGASPSELVSGFLSVISMVGSVISLFWDPLRLIPFAVLLALIATGMAPKGARLPLIAVAVGSICFVVGVTIAVTTKNPLY